MPAATAISVRRRARAHSQQQNYRNQRGRSLEYLIVVLVIAVALAPLVQLLPSARQRKTAALRECAALQGLFVEFRAMPGSHLSVKAPPGVIYYGRRFPIRRANAVDKGAWLLLHDGWHTVAGSKPITKLILDFPIEILAASVDESSCGIFWTESAEEGAVEQIKEYLERWIEELM